MYCQEDLHSIMIDELSIISNHFESLFISVRLNSTEVTIGTIYRPPSLPINLFIPEFKNKILTKLPPLRSIIVGDFNLDMNNQFNNHIINFNTEISNFNFCNLITEFTRVTSHSQTIIDHIWTSLPDIESNFVLEYVISDHFPIGCTLNIPKNDDNNVVKWRKFSPRNVPAYQYEFFTSFSFFTFDPDVNFTFSFSINAIENLINKHFPMKFKNKTTKTQKSPWIDKEFKKLIAKKHNLYEKYKLNLIPFHRYMYTYYRNLLKKTLRLGESDSLKNIFQKPV